MAGPGVPGGNTKGFATKQGRRLFAVIAVDGNGNRRIKDVVAAGFEEAIEKYRAVMPNYTPVEIGLLGGSGHPLKEIT